MEILVTRQFLEEARKAPDAVAAHVESLLRAAPRAGGACATPVDPERLLAWELSPGRLELLAIADAGRPAGDCPLADLSASELRDLGVADEAIGAVQGARSAAELERLGLPETALLRLRFRLVQKGAGEPPALERRAESLEHLEQYLRGRIADLLLNLDEAQRAIVSLPAAGPILVRGVAGSGKTAVALHRIHTLVRGGSRLWPQRILYLTFNRALVAAAKDLLAALGIRAGEVEVKNIHKWCRDFLGASGPRHLLAHGERAGLLAAARLEVKRSSRSSALWSYPESFWDEEIHRIKGHVLEGESQYVAMARHGAGRALDSRLRELVWRVCERYRALCRARRAADWDDVARRAHDKLAAMGGSLPAYDHVFVDEGQDFTPVMLRIASLLAGGPANLMVGFDPAQSIYEKGFRWRSCGITAQGGRSFALRKNHRNTRQILELARPLLDAIRSDPTETEGGGEDVIEPVGATRDGLAPRIVRAAAGEESARVASLVHEALERHRIPPQNIAVLCYKTHKRKRLLAALEAEGVLAQLHDHTGELRLRDPAVKVLTMHSAKGLEFPVVYLVASARDLEAPKAFADPADRAAFAARARKVMYMAMTRALAQLTIVYDAAHGSPLDALRAPQTSMRSAPSKAAPLPE